jgi:polyisoprenoid-binding protein YceI
MPRPLASLALAAALLGAPAGSARAAAEAWRADPARSRIVVHADKRGVLSGLAHDHHFAATSFRAAATFDPAAPSDVRLEVTVAADSLRDRQPALSPGDRDKVDRQAAGPQVLDAARHPEIRFVSSAAIRAATAAAGGAVDGELSGTLRLHGRERPIAVPVHATREGDGWRAKGTVRLRQSDFGISPFSTFLGTVAVRDEVTIEWDLLLVPAR